ncbi:MAG: 1,4-alpha-glucan-branching enzyme, partial [Clostridia bacterium]|nr:1,4-alpha-glucan-branching enzyme [Clostridia bacterium]
MTNKMFKDDPLLNYYRGDIELRMNNYFSKRRELCGEDGKLSDLANGHLYFGFHRTEEGWVYREWAPAAEEVYLTGDMVGWRWLDLRLDSIGGGVFEIKLPGDMLWDGCKV